MNKYELTCLFRSEEERTKAGKDSVLEELKKENVTVDKEDDWGIKDTAYLIKKNKKARYVYFELQSDPLSINKLNHQFLLNNDLLKFLFVKKD